MSKKNLSKKNKMKRAYEKEPSGSEALPGREPAPGKKERGQKIALSPELCRRIVAAGYSEKEAVSIALSQFLDDSASSGSMYRHEADAAIIDVQRRHIEDLSERLRAADRHYEDLLKTYQAYMVQIQPLLQAARTDEPHPASEAPDVSEPDASAGIDNGGSAVKTDRETDNHRKIHRKWYEFWK